MKNLFLSMFCIALFATSLTKTSQDQNTQTPPLPSFNVRNILERLPDVELIAALNDISQILFDRRVTVQPVVPSTQPVVPLTPPITTGPQANYSAYDVRPPFIQPQQASFVPTEPAKFPQASGRLWGDPSCIDQIFFKIPFYLLRDIEKSPQTVRAVRQAIIQAFQDTQKLNLDPFPENIYKAIDINDILRQLNLMQ